MGTQILQYPIAEPLSPDQPLVLKDVRLSARPITTDNSATCTITAVLDGTAKVATLELPDEYAQWLLTGRGIVNISPDGTVVTLPYATAVNINNVSNAPRKYAFGRQTIQIYLQSVTPLTVTQLFTVQGPALETQFTGSSVFSADTINADTLASGSGIGNLTVLATAVELSKEYSTSATSITLVGATIGFDNSGTNLQPQLNQAFAGLTWVFKNCVFTSKTLWIALKPGGSVRFYNCNLGDVRICGGDETSSVYFDNDCFVTTIVGDGEFAGLLPAVLKGKYAITEDHTVTDFREAVRDIVGLAIPEISKAILKDLARGTNSGDLAIAQVADAVDSKVRLALQTFEPGMPGQIFGPINLSDEINANLQTALRGVLNSLPEALNLKDMIFNEILTGKYNLPNSLGWYLQQIYEVLGTQPDALKTLLEDSSTDIAKQSHLTAMLALMHRR